MYNLCMIIAYIIIYNVVFLLGTNGKRMWKRFGEVQKLNVLYYVPIIYAQISACYTYAVCVK